jgi:hypothetical protein
MYEDQNMNAGADLPFTMTWGIDNPLLNMAAYMGVSLGAKVLRGGGRTPKWLPFGMGNRGMPSPMARVLQGSRAGRLAHTSPRDLHNLQNKYGRNRWMTRVKAKDLYPGRFPTGTAFSRGPTRFFERRAMNNQLLMRGLTQKFGPGMAARVAGYRALTGLLHITNLSFAGYMGAQLLGAAGDMVANWRPAQGITARRQLETGGPIIDTSSAMTMRSRALQAIHNSQIGTRAALGNEASFFHGDS